LGKIENGSLMLIRLKDQQHGPLSCPIKLVAPTIPTSEKKQIFGQKANAEYEI
jgi:hypothetical protein